jgi:hypothetical protein
MADFVAATTEMTTVDNPSLQCCCSGLLYVLERWSYLWPRLAVNYYLSSWWFEVVQRPSSPFHVIALLFCFARNGAHFETRPHTCQSLYEIGASLRGLLEELFVHFSGRECRVGS